MGGGQTAVRPVMLERDDELAQLEAALAEARFGRGSVILVCGDAGIGKTTMMRALAERAAPTDVQVRWGRTWEDGGAPAYWPWTQVLRAHTAETDSAALEKQLGAGALDMVQLVPELGTRLGITEARAPTQDAHGARFRLFEAVSTFLRAASAEAPILVILEDLHAADETSLSLLQFVTRQVDDAHLLIVGTYRHAEVATSPVHSRLLTGIAREATLQVVGGIGPASVRQLLEQTAGFVPQEALAHEVYETTEGNPFFVSEIARLLGPRLESGRGRLPLPEAVQAVIRRRVENVDPHVHRTLAAAAVMGREFDLRLLGAMTGQDPDHLLDTLGAAARLRIAEEVGLNRWSLIHALMRETLYEEVTLAERVRLHRVAAQAFERLRPDAVAEIAHHRFEAARSGTDSALAVAACEAAGQQAAGVLAYEQAVHWYARALEVLEEGAGEARRRYDLLVALGDAQLRGGSRPEGRATYRRAAEAARQLGDPELFGRAALGYFSGSAKTTSTTTPVRT